MKPAAIALRTVARIVPRVDIITPLRGRRRIG
jgi:hypothetical protein